MSITLTGATKLITLTSSTSFTDKQIYDACIDWSVLTGNMQYLLPMDFVSPDFRLINGWKFNASGYASGTLITVSGSVIALVGDRVNSGTDVEWDIGTANNTIIVAVGSGVTAQDKIDIAEATRAEMDTNSEMLGNLVATGSNNNSV